MLAGSGGEMVKSSPLTVTLSFLALESISGKLNPTGVIVQFFRASGSSPGGTWAQKELVGVQGDRGERVLVLS